MTKVVIDVDEKDRAEYEREEPARLERAAQTAPNVVPNVPAFEPQPLSPDGSLAPGLPPRVPASAIDYGAALRSCCDDDEGGR